MQTKTSQPMPYIGPETRKRAFTHPDSHPVALMMVLLRTFGKEFLAWEPETTWVEIGLTFGADPSALNRQKIQAAKTILVADSPYEQWDIFEAICFALIGQPPRFDLVQKASPMKCIFALDVMKNLRTKKKVSPEVYKYCAAALHSEGFVYGPGSLSPANTFLATFVKSEVGNAVQLLSKANKNVNLSKGSMLSLQATKSRVVMDFSKAQGMQLLGQMERLLR